MSRSQDLTAAKTAKKDEFYTQMVDIEKEMVYYRDYLRDKVVYCNCDNPEQSNFWRYFEQNFDILRLKALISTYYDFGRPVYKTEIHRNEITGRRLPRVRMALQSDGDFRSTECIDIMNHCDVVITNGPFSLFRNFVTLLIENDKKFVILGNMNAVSYKEIFPLIRDNKVWYGPSISSGDREFQVPDDYELNAAGSRIDEDGRKYIKVKGVRWFTNVDHAKRHEPLMLTQRYDPAKHLRYDWYDAINVDRTCDIPMDYDGVMGVPISFLDKYCPDQFEILGIDRYIEDNPRPGHRFEINGREIYARILIRRKK